jgi:hypothetical protein
VLTLGVASAALGKGLAVRSVDGLIAYGNVYAAGAGKSGTRKSVCAGPIIQPLYDFQNQLIRDHNAKIKEFLLELKQVREKIKALENAVPQPNAEQELQLLKSREAVLLESQTPPRIVVDDITMERLAILAGENNGVMASISPDARSAIKNLKGRYSSGSDTNEDILLKGFSVEPIIQDRVTRASVNTVACFAIVWLTQTDHLRGLYSKDALTDSGLLCRFLPFEIDYKRAPKAFDEVEPPKVQASRFYSQIIALLETYHQKHDGPFIISATPVARNILANFREQIEDQIECGSLEPIRAFACRLNEQAWRVALVLHGLENGNNSHLQKISGHNALAAVRIVRWFFEQTKRLVGAADQSKENTKLAIALEFVKKCKEGVTARDLQRHKLGLFKDSSDARDILETLVREDEPTREQHTAAP